MMWLRNNVRLRTVAIGLVVVPRVLRTLSAYLLRASDSVDSVGTNGSWNDRPSGEWSMTSPWLNWGHGRCSLRACSQAVFRIGLIETDRDSSRWDPVRYVGLSDRATDLVYRESRQTSAAALTMYRQDQKGRHIICSKIPSALSIPVFLSPLIASFRLRGDTVRLQA